MAEEPGIPGDGRCLFRSVVHGACLRLGKPSPSESHEKALADELRAKVADEFVKRRADTEWFLECDFDSYIKHIRKPHTWGGEPELLMATHVLNSFYANDMFALVFVEFTRVPITVYMREKSSESLIVISEYGQEYGRQNPIRVLYHGYGHYDALQVSPNGAQSKWFRKR
ncbi:OTU domain-containing protein [Nymphaea thermarum]|nr:OTU domain-containing protein [Nymphaea thermarum]